MPDPQSREKTLTAALRAAVFGAVTVPLVALLCVLIDAPLVLLAACAAAELLLVGAVRGLRQDLRRDGPPDS